MVLLVTVGEVGEETVVDIVVHVVDDEDDEDEDKDDDKADDGEVGDPETVVVVVEDVVTPWGRS